MYPFFSLVNSYAIFFFANKNDLKVTFILGLKCHLVGTFCYKLDFHEIEFIYLFITPEIKALEIQNYPKLPTIFF